MKSRIALVNLVFCSVLHGLNHYLLIFFKPMYPSIAGYFGLAEVADITTRMTVIYVSYAISNFIAGVLSARIGNKILLSSGMFLMATATMLVAFVPPDRYDMMVLLVFVMGLGGGTYHPAANTLVTSSYESRTGHAIGMLSLGSAAGFVAAPFIGQYLGAGMLGFRGLFFASGCLLLLFALVFVIFVKDPGHIRHERAVKPAAPGAGRVRSRGKLALAVLLMCVPVTIREMVGWSFYEITPFWVANGFGAGITIGLIQAMQYAPGIVVQPLTGRLCDRLSPAFMVILTFALMGAGFALFASPGRPVIWAAMAVFGTGAVASTVASETYMASLTSAAHRPLVYGVGLSVGLGLGGVLAGLSGRVVDIFGRDQAAGYRLWFFGAGALLVLSSLAYLGVDKIRKGR